MSYVVLPAAEQELASALEFYRQRGGRALAEAFVAEFERLARLLVSNPHLGTLAAQGLRIHPLRRFPYSIVYRVTSERIEVLVVGHHHRRPRYWRGRA